MDLFSVLAVIEFESENIDFYEMEQRIYKRDPGANIRQIRDRVYSSKLFQLWSFLYRRSPNYFTLDWLLSKAFGNGLSFFGVHFAGYNAMMWAISWKYGGYWWVFRPPCFLVLGRRGWTWGRLYKSPNSTPCHPQARLFYGKSPY